MKKLIIIPAYNESENIEKTVTAIEKEAPDFVMLSLMTVQQTIQEKYAKRTTIISSIFQSILELAGRFRRDTVMAMKKAMIWLFR